MGSYFFDIQYRNLQSKMDQDFLDIKYGLGKVSSIISIVIVRNLFNRVFHKLCPYFRSISIRFL